MSFFNLYSIYSLISFFSQNISNNWKSNWKWPKNRNHWLGQFPFQMWTHGRFLGQRCLHFLFTFLLSLFTLFVYFLGGSVGGLIDNQPLICGGNSNSNEFENGIILGHHNKKVQTIEPNRAYASSVVLDNTALWVSRVMDSNTKRNGSVY